MGKKKIFEKLVPDLKTDDKHGGTWKGKKPMAGDTQYFTAIGMENA